MARYVDTALRPGEKILYDAKVHWAIFLPPLGQLIGFVVFLAIAWGLVFSNMPQIKVSADGDPELKGIFAIMTNLFSHGWLVPVLVVLGFGGFIRALIYYFNSDFVLTDRRVIAKFGLLSRNTSEQRLSKVESIHVYQSLLGRLLDYGTITVTGTGSSTTRFGPMVNPVACKHALEEQLDRAREVRGED